MLPLSSVAAVILCLGLSALGAQEALDCIETENKQINKTKGERWTKRARRHGIQAGSSICWEPSDPELDGFHSPTLSHTPGAVS